MELLNHYIISLNLIYRRMLLTSKTFLSDCIKNALYSLQVGHVNSLKNVFIGERGITGFFS